MNITFWKRKLYSITNEEGLIEEHYIIYKLGLKGKNQLPIIMVVREYYHKVLNYADCIFKI